jgi:hypothetical protein
MTRPPPVKASPDGERAVRSGPENHTATASRGFDVIGLKERDHNRALQIEPGEVESLADQLEDVAKWPAEHWTLAFQGQIRPVSEHDADVLMQRLGAETPAAR